MDGEIQISEGVLGSPTDKDQCKDGGYTRFNDPFFREQGECVSDVVTRR